MSKKTILQIVVLVSLLISGLLVGCGPSAEEQVATSVALTATAATDTPTPTLIPTPTDTPTPTETPVPYDLSLIVTGEEDALIVGAHVILEEVGDETGAQNTDDVGQVFWNDLPGESVNIAISAQGYFPKVTSETIIRGINQVRVNLERDPHGLLPSEVCGPGQKLLYIEDFQDGEAQGWSEEIKFRTMGWDIIPHPDSQGNLVLVNNHDHGTWVELQDISFGDAVWHIQFMKNGNLVNNFSWHAKNDYTDETGHVDFSTYWAAFENRPDNYLAIHRDKDDSSVALFSRTGFYIEEGAWYQVDMSTFEGRFEFWLNDRQLVSYQDPAPLPAGSISINTYNVIDPEQIIYFDNISVCELTAPYVQIPTPGP